MITVQKVLLLEKVDLFAGMPARQLGEVAAVTNEVIHAAGSTIFREGEPGEALFVVVSGEVEVVHGGARVKLLGPADYFGELAVLTGETRNASVRAVTDCLLLKLERADFHRFLAGSFPAVLAVIKTISRRMPGSR